MDDNDPTGRGDAPGEAASPPAEEGCRGPAPSLVPLHPGDGPFRNMLAIPEAAAGFPLEAKREIRASAVRRLEALEQVHRQILEQAQQIVDAARRDLGLHDLPLNGTKIRGKTYHLYQREGRQPPRFFSLLAPEEYRQADPRARHLATYRLNEDSSWTRLDGGTAEPWLDP